MIMASLLVVFPLSIPSSFAKSGRGPGVETIVTGGYRKTLDFSSSLSMFTTELVGSVGTAKIAGKMNLTKNNGDKKLV